jgi:threonine dehydratase
MMTPPTFQDVLKARGIISKYLQPTPLYNHPPLDRLLGTKVYIKHENYQPIGAFKVRGGINLISQLTDAEKTRGVVTASTGNHGQSIAYAAKLFGVQATIIVPEGANPVKVEAIESHGAVVLAHGSDFDDAKAYCETFARENGRRYISSGDEPLLIAGVGTHTLEIVESLPDVDVIIVPVGGGSGASGACLVAKAVNPAIEVIAVQSEAAPAAYLTWKNQETTQSFMHSDAEGLATRAPFMLPQRIMWQHLDDFVLVSDEQLSQAVYIYLEKAKTLAELAGAASLAAALQIRDRLVGKKVALILSGGNISPEKLRRCL